MPLAETTSSPSKGLIWTGRVLSAIPILMMFFGGLFFGLFKFDIVQKGMTHYGYTVENARYILITEVACGLIYMVPQTAVLGAILMTGYLGGAVSTHVRSGESFAPPIAFGILVWLGLLLRDRRLWALLPIRRLSAAPNRSPSTASQSVDPIE